MGSGVFKPASRKIIAHKNVPGLQRKAVIAAATLPGFDHYHSGPQALTLGNVLGVAYDELTNKG